MNSFTNQHLGRRRLLSLSVAGTAIFDADNPGQWLTHCHNAYHAERGMMGVFSYIK
ncbi:multicopper oxidase domain-containing protein [Arthrobacter sp. PAMC25284]|uniref:multicopper oxidase domain-containing protein n=1 Tax=Arthrobacter sp. PAMC25284 TaxID=2861279 RepID=UPI0021594AFC